MFTFITSFTREGNGAFLCPKEPEYLKHLSKQKEKSKAMPNEAMPGAVEQAAMTRALKRIPPKDKIGPYLGSRDAVEPLSALQMIHPGTQGTPQDVGGVFESRDP